MSYKAIEKTYELHSSYCMKTDNVVHKDYDVLILLTRNEQKGTFPPAQ